MGPDFSVVGRPHARADDGRSRSLQQAALLLALERGVEGLTVEAICASAGVSTGTFFRYLATTEEALVGGGPRPLTKRAVRLFGSGGPTGELAGDMCHLLWGCIEPAAGRWAEMRARRCLIDRHPLLLPRVLVRFAAVEDGVASAVAGRLRMRAAGDARPRLLAAMAVAALQVAFRRWTDDGSRSLATSMGDVFAAFADLTHDMRSAEPR